MKFLLLLGFTIILTSFHHHANAQSATGSFRDKDGNNYTVQLMKDGKNWMTANLNIAIPGSYGYDSAAPKNNPYGRLYTWQAAQQVCQLLGDGWRLPTHEDWRMLTIAYGGAPEDSTEHRKKAYISLMFGGSAAFNAILGGGCDAEAKYRRVGAHGFYWTATKSDSSNAWFANFAKGSQSLYLQKDGETYNAFSIRCVKEK